MKKLILLALAASLLPACSIDDDASPAYAEGEMWEDEPWGDGDFFIGDDPHASGILGKYKLSAAPRRAPSAVRSAQFSVVFEEDTIRGVGEPCGEFTRGYFIMGDMLCPSEDDWTGRVQSCEQSPQEWNEVSGWLMDFFGNMDIEPYFEVDGDRLIVDKGDGNIAVFVRDEPEEFEVDLGETGTAPWVPGVSSGGAGGAPNVW